MPNKLPFEDVDFAQMARGIDAPRPLQPLPKERSSLAQDIVGLAKTGIETYGEVKKARMDDKRKAEINTINAIKAASAIAGLGLKTMPQGMGLSEQQWGELQAGAQEKAKPDKQSKVDDWVTEDLTDPANPKYFINQAVSDGKTGIKTIQGSIDRAGYEQMKRKEAAGPRPDKLETDEANRIKGAGWDAGGVDKYGNPVWKRFPPAIARKRLMDLRASYFSQRNIPAVNAIDNELSLYGEAAIGDGKKETALERLARVAKEAAEGNMK